MKLKNTISCHLQTAWLMFSVISGFVAPCIYGQSDNTLKVERWDIYEVSLVGPAEGNPYMDIEISSVFENDQEKISVPGFYDGNGMYRIRFSPNKLSSWSYVTQSNHAKLNGQRGSFECIPPSNNNHGPVKIVNTHYLEYADGTPFYCVGTTAYQWTSVKQSIQETTLQTLATSPFNKVRMCVFPKHYKYGNDTEPWALPFERQGDVNDPTRPNYIFFQNFDKRVHQLLEMGIQADVILFHPYDKWGFFELGKEMNERYVRYMIARLSAYRNVWWSLANEWDVPRIKDAIDWEGIGELLQREDPHQRLRGIHNWYYDESHFYDHSRPWITHISAQSYFFFNAAKWRNKFEKPLLFDEMRYEGDVSSDWGNMNAKEMTSYFWQAGLSGIYGTHGETYQNSSDPDTEVRWWAKGGTLLGNSSDRIAFFRQIMEEAPVSEMKPQLMRLSDERVSENVPDKNFKDLVARLNHNIYTLSKAGEYYLVYSKDSGQKIELFLAGDQNYDLQVIDTWNMKIVSETTVKPGAFEYISQIPYMAMRLVSKPQE